MLSLNDNRWSDLTTFFEEPADVPKIIAHWLSAVGTDEEDLIYRRDLCDVFLHQATITNVAFAVVPWLIEVCKRADTRHRLMYLTDAALVEANRLKYGVYYHRKGTEESPDWLMPDYHQAILDSRELVEKVIKVENESEEARGLLAMKPALYGNAELAWAQW